MQLAFASISMMACVFPVQAVCHVAPLEELHVLGVFDESRSHHDGLETLTVDRPQLHVDQS